jgi:hypothetical protein
MNEKILILYIASYGLYEGKNLVRDHPICDQKTGRIKKKQFPWISADLTPTGSKKALPQEKIAGD